MLGFELILDTQIVSGFPSCSNPTEVFGTFDFEYRDPRGWSVSVCFSALIAYQACKAHIDTVSEARWIAIEDLDALKIAFDHRSIIDTALKRLRQKALYSIVPAYALPKEFTLPELQRVHEIILDTSLDKKAFRRRIENAKLLEKTEKKGRAERGKHHFIE